MLRFQSIVILSFITGVGCGGGEATPKPPTNYLGSDAGSTGSQSDASVSGTYYDSRTYYDSGTTTSTGSCPSSCPDDCDSLGQCRYQINPEGRYRVTLLSTIITQDGAKFCSLAGVIGLYTPICDPYVILRTHARDYKTATSSNSNSVFEMVSVPEITVAELEQNFEVIVMDDNYEGEDVEIAACRPDLTREILEYGSMTLQCGGLGSTRAGQSSYESSYAVVKLKLIPLDGGAITRLGNN